MSSVSRLQNSKVYVYYDDKPYGYIVSQTMYIASDTNDDTKQTIEQDIRKHRTKATQKGAQKMNSFQEWLTRSRDYMQKDKSFIPNLRIYCNQTIYGTQDGTLEAKGGVLVEDSRKTKISSNSLVMNMNNGKAELSGNTQVEWPKGNISAKSCVYDLEKESLTCSHADGTISIFSRATNRFLSTTPKYGKIRTYSVYQQNDMESVFEILNSTCRCMENEPVPSESLIVLKSDELQLQLSQKQGMRDEWFAKKVKVYSPLPMKHHSLHKNIPQLPFSIQAQKIACGGKDLQLSGAKLCLGEKVQIPYLSTHICLDGLPCGNFSVGYQLLDMDGWYLSKPVIKPLWFANHRAHLHVATLVSLSKEKSFQDRLALVCSLSWNSKNNDCRWMTDVIVHSPLSYWRQNNPCNTTRDIQTTPIMTTSSTLSSVPSHSRLSRSYFYASDKEHSWIDNKESGWNRCRAHFLWEKECKRYNGKWTIYGNWRTKVFNPATAYLETTFQPMEGNNVKVSEWRELSHCLGASFQKNPLQTRYRHGQLWRQWEIGMESLKADRLEEEEYHYGFGVSDERQEPIQRTFANLEMEYLHFLWKEQNASSTIPRNGLPLSSFLAMTGSLVARMEKLKAKPFTARATCGIGFQGQIGKLRRKWLDFSGFSVQISQTMGTLSTFLFEREEQRTALNCGIVQQLYGNCRVGVEKRWTWETACWQPMETQLSLQFLGDTYAIATSYKMEQGTAKFSCRWLW